MRDGNGNWWRQAVMYQLYPRSFRDGNGDGIGDFAGAIRSLPYLKELGVDGVWLNPIYKSGFVDGGYDVIDYRDVAEQFGTLDDFKALVDAVHEQGMHIIIDIVPNHTSTDHPWFRKALASAPGSPERDLYIFRDGRGEHGELPPTDWLSKMGGPAWQRVPDGQWYLHIYAKEQADLNWNSPIVRREFEDILRFWGDLGVDGFRVDVANGMAKQIDGRDDLDDWTVDDDHCPDGRHPLWDRDEVHEIYRGWRRVFNEYDPPLCAVAEISIVPEHEHRYASKDELGQVFNFDLQKAMWSYREYRDAIDMDLASARRSRSSATWVLSNHDCPRAASRYGLAQVTTSQPFVFAWDWLLRDGTSYPEDIEAGTRRARAAALIELALPGTVYIYQGDELGLREVPDIPWDRLEDPTAFDTVRQQSKKGRDGCRVPLPWDSADMPRPAAWSPRFGEGASFGFSVTDGVRSDGNRQAGRAEPHLPQPLWFADYAIDRQSADRRSMLNLYRDAIRLRSRLFAADRARTEPVDVDWLDIDGSSGRRDGADGQYGGVLAFARQGGDGRMVACVTNFCADSIDLPAGEVLLASGPLDGYGKLPQDTTVWVVLE
ncbi:glycoside hydrolase family 13 protein [Bifidobacterium aerophilum]|uniref:Alpha-amylase n=1 Tax=Bifidobacterium aerophilum TaxID=1798155 RepID=A0A6N9Z7D0_9BIFI|nr:glycoside hydrolase family 13 protein [Bifidobacterium aerophilum]NEG90356.1 alpha-amylase [Bifidobacterium aerophilum]